MRIKSAPKLSRKNQQRSEFKYLDGVIYAADYSKNPELKAAISQFKYKYTRELNAVFVSLLIKKLSELYMLKKQDFFLVPVPLHKKRLAHRGFNQSDLLANGVANKFEKPVKIELLLNRVKNTSQQAKLKKIERRLNLKNAFQLNKGSLKQLSQKVCFLVDDVCTTGSTLDECARVLKQEAGLEKVYGLVVARAVKEPFKGG